MFVSYCQFVFLHENMIPITIHLDMLTTAKRGYTRWVSDCLTPAAPNFPFVYHISYIVVIIDLAT